MKHRRGTAIGVRRRSGFGRDGHFGRKRRNTGVRRLGPRGSMRPDNGRGMEKNPSERADIPYIGIPLGLGIENGGIRRSHVEMAEMAWGEMRRPFSSKRILTCEGNPVRRRNGNFRRGIRGIPKKRLVAPRRSKLREHSGSGRNRCGIRQTIGVRAPARNAPVGNMGIRSSRVNGNSGGSRVLDGKCGDRARPGTQSGSGRRTVAHRGLHDRGESDDRKRRLVPLVVFRDARHVRVRAEGGRQPLVRAENRESSGNAVRHVGGYGRNASRIGRGLSNGSRIVHVVQRIGDSDPRIRGGTDARGHTDGGVRTPIPFDRHGLARLRGPCMDERRSAFRIRDSLGDGIRNRKNRSGRNFCRLSRFPHGHGFCVAFPGKRKKLTRADEKKRGLRVLFSFDLGYPRFEFFEQESGKRPRLMGGNVDVLCLEKERKY